MTDSFVADGEVHDSMATGHRPWFGTKRPLPENDDPPRHGSAGRGRRQRPRSGALPADDDERPGRRAQRRRQGADDAPGQPGVALLRLRLVRGLRQRDGLAHRGRAPGSSRSRRWSPPRRTAVVVLVNGGQRDRLRGDDPAAQRRHRPALGLDYAGEGSRWSQKALFIGLVLLPIGYLLSMVWAWRHRAAIRAKSGAFGPVQPVVPATHHPGRGMGRPRTWCRPCSAPRSGPCACSSPTWACDHRHRRDRRAVGLFRLAVAYTGRPGHAELNRPGGVMCWRCGRGSCWPRRRG